MSITNVCLKKVCEHSYKQIFYFYSSNIGKYRHTMNIGHHCSEPENTNELSFNLVPSSTNQFPSRLSDLR